ncbi:hypothetical protein CBS63078_9563 [Aspergillus niger]|nr:hypothetical protein CBS115989_3234 [Aspergillus niger]KAI2825798.1 hypothetical protein CBS133816_8154 [Aspergillus niger]KAI2836828.1 hypothetical protein CBS11350_9118 [Aspergillus niger]KAI2852403.1 hypothetical protein CBS11232_5696 [Aspergillus niger]KAI2854307.1 hypothetical protein CBS12448_7790 [Aspergillus niger]
MTTSSLGYSENGCRLCPTSLISQFSALLDPCSDVTESGYGLGLEIRATIMAWKTGQKRRDLPSPGHLNALYPCLG